MKYRKIFLDIISAFIKTKNYELNPDLLNSNAYPLDLEFTLKRESQYYSSKDSDDIPL